MCVFTVRLWLEQFAKQKRTSRSYKTALQYDQMINEFVEFLGSRADLNAAACHAVASTKAVKSAFFLEKPFSLRTLSAKFRRIA
jgi:hypothetical protein